LSAKEATYRAMKDISAPVVAIALILAAVFVPVGFIPGIVGRLYQQFAITIAISVMLSAFIALSLTPALCALLLKPSHLSKDSRWLGKFFYRFNVWFEALTGTYAAWSGGASRDRNTSLSCSSAFVPAPFCYSNISRPGLLPTEDDGRLYVTYQLLEGSSTTQSVEVITKLMQIIGSTTGVNHYSAISGLNILNAGTTSNSGTFFACSSHGKKRTKPEERIPGIMDVLRKRIAAAGINNANIIVIPPRRFAG